MSSRGSHRFQNPLDLFTVPISLSLPIILITVDLFVQTAFFGLCDFAFPHISSLFFFLYSLLHCLLYSWGPLAYRASFSILYPLSLVVLPALPNSNYVYYLFLPNTSHFLGYGPCIRDSLTCLHISYLKTFENSKFQTIPQADEFTVPRSRKSSDSKVQTTLEIPVYKHHQIWKSW